ncbi:MAG: cytochrome b5-like heme/steroid binding domain-containing protein [Minisyncoccia bacterium]
MTTKTLLSIITGIFVLSMSAYFFVSPIATRTLDNTLVAQNSENYVVSTSSTPTEKLSPVQETQPTPKPTPTTPKPKPTPAPVTGYTASEVALHASENSCWSIVNKSVYNLTSYISRHPGGAKKILRICGIDGTSAFEGQHAGESSPEKTLKGYYIGLLK